MPGAAEHVAAELDLEAGIGRALADHAVGVDAVVRQHVGLADRRAEERLLAVLPDPRRDQPPALAAGVVVLNAHRNGQETLSF